MKYKVKQDCYGYKRRYWTAGQIVDLSDNETPPHHFEKVLGAVVAPEPPKEVKTLSEIGKPPVITTGMAAGLNNQDTVNNPVPVVQTKGGRRKK